MRRYSWFLPTDAQLKKLSAALGKMAKHTVSNYSSLQPHRPGGDPNQFWHTVDCNLHTILLDGLKHGKVQLINVKSDGLTRLQFVNKEPELYFFVDVDNDKGTVEYLLLDRAIDHKETHSYPDVVAAIQGFEDLLQPKQETTTPATQLLNGGATPALAPEAAKLRWEELAAQAKRLRGKMELSTKTKFSVDKAHSGLKIDSTEALKLLKAELGKGKDLGAVALLRRVLTDKARESIGQELAQSWVKATKKTAATRWILEASTELGSSKVAAILGAFVASKIDNSSAHHQVVSVAKALERSSTPEAVQEIFFVDATPSRYAPRRLEARAILERIATGLGMSYDHLVSTAIPETLAAAPKKRFVSAQGRRLEGAMVDGDRVSFATIKKAAPLLAEVQARVVWATFDEAGKLKRSFRISEGQALSPKAKKLRVDDAALVGVVHPAELGDAIEVWAQVKELKTQSFAQLSRPLHRMSAKQKACNEIYDFKFYRRDWLHELSWWGLKYNVDWADSFDTLAVVLVRDKKHVEMKMTNTGGVYKVGLGRMKDSSNTEDGYWKRSTDTSTFGDLHPVSQSEILYAFLGDSVAKSPAAAAQSRAPSRGKPSGGFPRAEMAKSSRSACLVCKEKIAKETIRVVVEREVKSDAFTGMRPAYLHAACATEYPEFAELADLDERIAANSSIPWPA